MVSTKTKYQCCGCTACLYSCPTNAISMKFDREGFVYPVIDDTLCIDCSKCDIVCSFTHNKLINDFKIRSYAFKNNDERVREKSQSGGAFISISDYFLNKNGVVYGVGYDATFAACHKRAITKEQRNEFVGSKYVQSNMNNIFGYIKDDLCSNKLVLFSGTPCQVAGLKSYLRNEKNIDNLYTVDLLCHGVPSPLVWKDYLSYINKSYGQIMNVTFRDKSYGWRSHMESFYIRKSKISKSYFAKLFHGHLIIRPCCFNCPYTNINREGDLTIGDFWGIERVFPEFEDKLGVSLVMINTQKGNMVFDYIKKSSVIMECNIEDCIQQSLAYTLEEPENRNKFWEDFITKDFKYIMSHYLNHGYWIKLKRWIRKRIANIK